MKTTNYRWDYKISLGGTEQMMGLEPHKEMWSIWDWALI
jgi:hypothetical protein